MQRRGFTLIELLVVIAIISVLAAMLLPSIDRSLEMARRVRCLDDRRQNHLGLCGYAFDHNGRVPTMIRFWQHGERDLNTVLTGNSYATAPRTDRISVPGWFEAGAMELAYESNSQTKLPLGILAGLQYFGSSDSVMCPAFPKGKAGYNRRWIDEPATWKAATDWSFDTTFWYISFGITQYLFASLPGTGGVINPKLALYGEKHDQPGVSPMLMSCANYTYGTFGTGPTIARSHEQEGMNGAFYDGSARWIDVQEIDPTGARFAAWGTSHMVNDTASNGAPHLLQIWARTTLTLARP